MWLSVSERRRWMVACQRDRGGDAEQHGVRLVREFASEALLVRVDPDLMKQAVLNLVLNGVEAMPRGGTLNDGGVNVEFQLRPEVTVSGSVQYEKWNYPLLALEAKSNWATSVGFIFWPHLWK